MYVFAAITKIEFRVAIFKGHHCGSENIGLSYSGKWLSEVPTSSTVSLLLKKDVVKSFWYTGPGRHNNLLGMGHFDDSNDRERLQNLS